MKPTPNAAWLTSSEAASICGGVSAETLRRWSRDGRFPLFLVTEGGQFRVLRKHVAQYMRWKVACAYAKRSGIPTPEAPVWADPLADVLTVHEEDAHADAGASSRG